MHPNVLYCVKRLLGGVSHDKNGILINATLPTQARGVSRELNRPAATGAIFNEH